MEVERLEQRRFNSAVYATSINFVDASVSIS